MGANRPWLMATADDSDEAGEECLFKCVYRRGDT